MLEDFDPNRYSIIEEKNKREIVMLRGRGCSWKRCRFCDYHLDSDPSEEINFKLNSTELLKVTGIYKKLEIINSGSFVDLDIKTMDMIENIAINKNIKEVYFECHWNDRESVAEIKERFLKNGIVVKVKTGIETFDFLFRESYLIKGITTNNPLEIARYFDECCLLQGIPGQTVDSMLLDIAIGLQYFERVCINIMQNNDKPIKSDPKVIRDFLEKIYPIYKDDYRVDILMENTAFGVGGIKNHE